MRCRVSSGGPLEWVRWRALWASGAGYLASESGERRVEAFALFQICEGMGACLGPVLGVVLFQIGFQLVCVMASVIFLVLTILQLCYLPRRGDLKTSAPRPVWSEWKEVLANRTFVVFALGMVAYLSVVQPIVSDASPRSSTLDRQ